MNGKLHSLGNCCFYLFVLVGSSILGLVLMALVGMGSSQSGINLVSGLIAAAAAALLLHRREPDFYKALPSRKWLLKAMGYSLLVTFLVQGLPYAAPPEMRESLVGRGFYQQPLLDFLATVLVSPVAEELVFRGLILTELEKTFSPRAAALLGAAVFGVLHGQVVWALMAFFMGLLYTWLRRRTGTLYAPVAAHMVSNLLAFFVNYTPGG